MTDHTEKYNKLNSFYLFLWECLDEFFENGTWLSGVSAEIPQIRVVAKKLNMVRELTNLKDIGMEELRLADRPQVKENAVKQFKGVIPKIEEKLNNLFEELKSVGVPDEDLKNAEKDMKEFLVLISEYAELSSDINPWIEKARELKNDFGNKALESSLTKFPKRQALS